MLLTYSYGVFTVNEFADRHGTANINGLIAVIVIPVEAADAAVNYASVTVEVAAFLLIGKTYHALLIVGIVVILGVIVPQQIWSSPLIDRIFCIAVHNADAAVTAVAGVVFDTSRIFNNHIFTQASIKTATRYENAVSADLRGREGEVLRSALIKMYL